MKITQTADSQKLQVAQIVEWDNGGQSCIALLRGATVIGRFRNYDDAGRAYRDAKKGSK